MLRFIITISNTQYPLYPVQMNIETTTHVAAQHAFNKMRHVFEDLGLPTKGTGFTFSVEFSDGSVLTYTMRQNHADATGIKGIEKNLPAFKESIEAAQEDKP